MDLKLKVRKNTQWTGQEVLELTGGQKLKIKSAGEEILNEKCPAGHTWDVIVSVHITQHENV